MDPGKFCRRDSNLNTNSVRMVDYERAWKN